MTINASGWRPELGSGEGSDGNSVARGFLLSEWKALFEEASFKASSIQWKWAFRHLIIYHHPL
jgi:hypothetical protein